MKIEEAVLNRAMQDSMRLRLSLSSRERLSCVVKEFGKFDVSVETGTAVLALSKKDLYYFSSQEPLIVPPAPGEEQEPEGKPTRSRVQDEFLSRYVKDRTLALLTLVNGEEHRGVIEGFDGFTVLMKSGAGQMLVYKHGILSIGPGYRRRPKDA